MGKMKNAKKSKAKNELIQKNCKTSEKIGVNTKKRKAGRPKGTAKIKQLEPSIHPKLDRIHKTSGLFKPSQANQPIPTKEFIEYLFSVITKEERLIEAFYYSGCRVGEAEALQWKDKIGSELKVLTSKKRDKKEHYRYPPLPPEIWEVLYELQDEGYTEKGYIFKPKAGGGLDGILKRLTKRLLLSDLIIKETNNLETVHKKLTTHMFRRSIITELWENKLLSLDQLVTFAGHKQGDYRSLRHYLPALSQEFNVQLLQHYKGFTDPIIGTQRESRLKELFSEVLDAKLIPILQSIKV